MSNKNKKNIWKVVLYIVIIVVTVVNLLPYFWMMMNSFRSPSEPITSSIIPHKWSIEPYVSIFKGSTQQTANTLRALGNSFFISTVSTLITAILALLSAYGFSRFRFKGRDFLMSFLVNLRTFPGILLAISLFVMAGKFGLMDTFTVVILANAMLNLPFAIWNNISIIDNVPVELEESGMIDGLSRVKTLRKIVFPVKSV